MQVRIFLQEGDKFLQQNHKFDLIFIFSKSKGDFLFPIYTNLQNSNKKIYMILADHYLRT